VLSDGVTECFGCLADVVQLDDTQFDWYGADTCDNISAELTALLVAQSVALRNGWQDVIVRPDLILGPQLAALDMTCGSNPKLAKLIRLHQQWMPHMRMCPVPGHSKHAWNDLADSVARWAAAQGRSIGKFQAEKMHELALTTWELDWAWMQHSSDAFAQCLPPLIDHQYLQFPPNWKETHSHAPMPGGPTPPLHKVALQVVSANVLALDPIHEREVGRLGGTRTLRLDHQWNEAGFQIAGLQETRTPAGQMASQHYVIYSSGADFTSTASLGCELWIHRTRPLFVMEDGSQCRWSDAHVVTLHADPRRLVLKLTWPGMVLILASLHAPYIGNGHKPESVARWWHETVSILPDTEEVLSIICADANAPLGNSGSCHIGDCGGEPVNDATACFEDAIHAMQWWVPSTFQDCHQGPSWTWTHPRGHRLRRDYILLPLQFRTWEVQSWTLQDHDTTFAHEDHIPVALRIQGMMAAQRTTDGPKDSPKIGWDKQALRDPIQCAKFRDALLTLPVPSWDVTPETHCKIWEQQLLQLGQQFFAPKSGKRKRLHLPEAAVNMIAFKRQMLDFGRANDLLRDPQYRLEIQEMEKSIRPHVRKAQRQFYDQLILQSQDEDGRIDTKELFHALLRLGRKSSRMPNGPRPLPALKGPDGNFVHSFEAQQRLWYDQFQRIEAGFEVTWDALSKLNGTGPTCPRNDLEPDLFVSDWKIQRSLKHMRRGKAPGPNMLPTDLLKIAGPAFTRQMNVLLCKVTASAREPLTWKGGRTFPLWKQKGSPHLPESYRSIFVSSYTAKLYHHALRDHLTQCWERLIDGFQCGGRAAYSTDVANHYIQAHGAWCAHKQLPHATLLFDLRAAFYSVYRQTLTTVPLNADRLAFALSKHGVMPDDLDRLIEVLSGDARELELSPHLDAVLRDLMDTTYFEMPGVTNPCVTTRGTRPGDPIGDVLFNITMSLVLRDMRSEVLETHDIQWFGQGSPTKNLHNAESVGSCAFGELAFVDDCAVMLHAPNNAQLQQAVWGVLQAFINAARKRGLELNWGEGKTELLWAPSGPGSKVIKQQLARDGACLHGMLDGAACQLRVVSAYKHLGTWLQTGSHHAREVRARISAARSGWGSLLESFYRRKEVPSAMKRLVFSTVTGARHLYNAHVWTRVTDKDLTHWHEGLRPMLAVLVRKQLQGLPAFKFNINVLAGLAQMLPPHDALHLARLRYVQRMMTLCPDAFWTFVLEDSSPISWKQRCMQSFRWFLTHYDHQCPVNTDSTFLEWVQFIRLDQAWKGRLKTAATACRHFHHAKAMHALHIAMFEREFVTTGAVLPLSHANETPESWECDQCGQSFATVRALSTHAYKRHGYKDIVRYYALGSRCNSCNQEFHSRPRRCRHLRTQEACLAAYKACFPPASEAEVEQLDIQDRIENDALRQQGWHAHKALEACIILPGPALPPANDPAAAHIKERAMQGFVQEQRGYEQLQGRCILPQRRSHDGIWWLEQDLPAFVFQSAGGMQKGDGRCSSGGLARIYASLHIRCLVVVHFFSGFRRTEDLHTVIDQQSMGGSTQLFTISVDLCMQRISGDLARDEAVSWWVARAASGQLAACGGGPPCETYTAARNDKDGGPRTLRNQCHPAGKPTLAPWEWEQIKLGEKLMHFTQTMMLAMVKYGGCGFAEHPQWPLWISQADSASVWSSRQWRLLRTLECVQVTSFDQCCFGASAKKPTTILTVRLSSFRHRAMTVGFGGRCPHPKQYHKALRGKNDEGQYRTAAHKIYPPMLNKALGEAIYGYVVDLAKGIQHVDPVPDVYDPYRCQTFAALDIVQPDFYRGAG